MLLAVAAISFADESWIHTPPEYGMAEALEDHIEQACANKIAPELLIIGDSRAVAGVSVREIRAAGVDAEKFALGGSGIFAGWATLDRLIDCGVRPKAVVMAYGTVHMLDQGAVMDRTTNYDLLKGPRASHAYAMAAEWEHRKERQLTYKAVSVLGAEATGVDFVLLRPSLRNVFAGPPLVFHNRFVNEQARKSFHDSLGDQYYGAEDAARALPEDEQRFQGDKPLDMNSRATQAIADLGKANGFPVYFYVLPVSEMARRGLPPKIFEMADSFRDAVTKMGVVPLNDVWALPDADFGDPSHVNPRGRAKVTADFLARLRAEPSLAGADRRSGAQGDDTVTFAVQEVEKVGQ